MYPRAGAVSFGLSLVSPAVARIDQHLTAGTCADETIRIVELTERDFSRLVRRFLRWRGRARHAANIPGGMLLRQLAKRWSPRRPQSRQLKRWGFRSSVGHALLASGECDSMRLSISPPKEDH